MSDIINEAVGVLSEKVSGFDGSIKFVIEDEGTIMVDGDGVRPADEDAECTMTANAETFQGILDNSVNPTMAFMSGKLKVDGNMGMALKLSGMLS